MTSVEIILTVLTGWVSLAGSAIVVLLWRQGHALAAVLVRLEHGEKRMNAQDARTQRHSERLDTHGEELAAIKKRRA